MSSVTQAEESRTRRYRGVDRLYLVGGEHGQESPDVRITEEDRRLVRQLVEELESALSAELLVHLACGTEAAAQRKRSLEAST
jgi:cob(I)alamin adenosyltransferase